MMPRILLVEDNEMNLDMLSRRLMKRGYEVVTATDGQQGIDLAIKELPDIVLMDMSLPVVDGWEAVRQLKNNGTTKSIPIIALTAHAIVGDKEKCMQAGCDDYATKPIDFKALVDQLRRYAPGHQD